MGLRMGGGGVAGTEALGDGTAGHSGGREARCIPELQAPGKEAGELKGGGGPLSDAGAALRRGQTEGRAIVCAALLSLPAVRLEEEA